MLIRGRWNRSWDPWDPWDPEHPVILIRLGEFKMAAEIIAPRKFESYLSPSNECGSFHSFNLSTQPISLLYI